MVEDEEKLAGCTTSAVDMEHRDAYMAAACKEEHMAWEAGAHKRAAVQVHTLVEAEAGHTLAALVEHRPAVMGEQNLPHKGSVAAPPHSPTT
jgi:hypothetical protein